VKFVLPLLACALLRAQAGEVRGTVVDARGGESLGNVAVQFTGSTYRTITDSTGSFRIVRSRPAITSFPSPPWVTA
jgi:hypothetical protein